ncbi:MAG: hypothetical protein HYX66_01400 [Ignavibacteria bacterium]|nr:hypothetical protein [Ignavibacteria bacterium]
MKSQLKILTGFIALALIVASCSENTNNPTTNGSYLQMKTAMTNQTITSNFAKSGDAVQNGSGIDSIRVDSVRILIKRIKLLRSEDDTTGEGEEVKIGPTVIHFNSDTADTHTLVFTKAIPVGSYRKMKMEMHRFTPGEAADYAADPEFGPFAFPDRLTIIVDGTVYADSASRPFQFTQDWTENFWFEFDPFLDITEGTTAIEWTFDASRVFKGADRLLDPDDENDHGSIGDGLKKSWKVLKKWHRD